MPHKNDLEKQINDLQEKIQILQVENDHLAERAEDTLLLGLVGEKINSVGEIDEVFEFGLERISILKNIPFCACCSLKNGNLTIVKSFFSFTNETLQDDIIELTESLTVKISEGSYLLHGEECRKSGISISLQSFQYRPTSIFFIPFKSLSNTVNLFFFADNEEEDKLGSLDLLLHRIVEMIGSRADRLSLINELKKMNLELDHKVENRAKELFKVNQDLQQQINERQEIEDSLRESEELYRSLVENIDFGVTLINTDYKIVMVNSAQGRMFNRSPASFIGKNCHREFEKRDQVCPHCPGNIAMTTGLATEVESEGILDDGSKFTVKIRAFPILSKDGNSEGFIEVVEDITDSKRLEYELQKSERIEALGILAGGIAHDFNNLLTAILGNISLARLRLKDPDKVSELLAIAEKASLRASDLTNQLLTFSKGGAPLLQPASIIDIIKDSTGFALRGSSCKCEFSLSDDLWPVKVDVGQISQVIQNISLNSIQAMPVGGVLTIQGRNKNVSNADNLPITTGQYVKITISDTGIGIPEEVLGRIFEPYFTTKQTGSGLGLATCYSIMKQHGGFINVYSEAGKGTSFNIYIPVSEQKVATKKDKNKIWDFVGSGKILIMDDEEVVRVTLGNMLEHMGFEVFHAQDGQKAINSHKEALNSGEPFVAVVLDLTIPGGMGGKKTVKALKEIDPEIKVIVSSGYANDPIMANYKEYNFDDVITKPYHVDELTEALQRIGL